MEVNIKLLCLYCYGSKTTATLHLNLLLLQNIQCMVYFKVYESSQKLNLINSKI